MKKKFFAACASALLIAAQIFAPAEAAARPAGLAAGSCGDTYVVQPFDALSKIAEECDVSLSSIIAMNPQILNPNLIFAGQVLRISGSVDPSVIYSYTYLVQDGDTLQFIAELFGTTIWAIKAANQEVLYSGQIYPGLVLKIPNSTVSNYTRVQLSDTTVSAGDSLTVFVYGFPGKAEIDYRIGKVGAEYSAVYDGEVDADGTTNASVTIPTTAKVGDYWIVLVTTTDQVEGVKVFSEKIKIVK